MRAVDPKIRFWWYVQKTDTCWIWTGGKIRGYGQFRNAPIRPTDKAHRFSYELYNGAIPDGLFVLHSCDNKLCVNPEHLFLGTHQDNMYDRNSKKRQAMGRGNGNSKLTEEQALNILQRKGHSREMVAKEFGVSIVTVERIQNGRSWKHISSV